MVKNPPAIWELQEMQVGSLHQKILGEEGMVTLFSILAWGIPDRGAWQSTVHRVAVVGHA